MTTFVLIVDDEPDIRFLARLTLERLGHSVGEAGDGSEALAKMREDEPHLVLLDIRMPGVDGWEVLETMQGDPSLATIPVVMMSAHTDPRSVQKALENGCKGFLSKPFSMEELQQTVETHRRT
ncbi:MAG: response regulator [Actinomycetota bacterium]|nr:response regulator [Actinomycetota bacterium]